MELQAMGIDLGKTLFHLVGVDACGNVVVRKRCSRTQLLRYAANDDESYSWGFGCPRKWRDATGHFVEERVEEVVASIRHALEAKWKSHLEIEERRKRDLERERLRVEEQRQENCISQLDPAISDELSALFTRPIQDSKCEIRGTEDFREAVVRGMGRIL